MKRSKATLPFIYFICIVGFFSTCVDNAKKSAIPSNSITSSVNYTPPKQPQPECTFKNPLHCSYRISSPYGYRISPVSGNYRNHNGIDLACFEGNAIYASADGKITSRSYDSTYGNQIVITHANGYKTRYAHMDCFGNYSVGDYVYSNQIIGYVGSTGESTGPHCHFEIIKNGYPVDPESVIRF